jgi:hypothetical protein
MSSPVSADPTAREQLAACVDKHLTADDSVVMRRLLFFLMSDALQADSELQSGVAAKRDEVSTNAAALITRLSEQDCKAEVRALMAERPVGGAFKPIFDAITKPVLASLAAGMPKAAATVGLDIIKRLDAKTVADIQLMDTPTPATAPANGNTHLTRAAVSGVRLRVAFETALNPDCSVMGKTVMRLLKSPSHGTATIEDTMDFTAYDSANQRYRCNEKRSAGTAMYYKSQPGYTGPDAESYEVIFPSGVRRMVDVDITVN